VLIFVLGLLLGSSNPAKEEEREFLRYHGKAVSIFVLGLLLGTSNPAKEEEREFLTQTSRHLSLSRQRRVNFLPDPATYL
jgi:hypothetical protein